MRPLAALVASIAALAVAGCYTPDDSQSTAPSPTPTAPLPPVGSSEGCTGNHTVGAGNGDITADHACNATATNSTMV
jgi:hypothetical protein